MTTNEFQARALFDFCAEGPSELSLHAGEIITITSGTNGNDWWYAQNSSGQFGAVPATYVEILSNELKSNQNKDDSDTRRISATNYQPRLEEERQDSMTLNRIDQSNHSTDHEFTPDSSFDSLSSPIISDNLLSSNSLDTSQNKTEIFDPITSSTKSQDQQNSLLGDIKLSSPVSKTDYVYDTPTLSLIPETSNETISTSTNISSNDLITDNSSLQTTKSSDENLSTKSKPEKTKLFSLKRAKSKSDLDKRRNSVENGLDATSKDDSDSDCSGSPHNTLSGSSGSYRRSSGASDSKTLPRAKFFDKHGVGNYLLHECKTNSDEHIEITYNENEGGVCWAINPDMPPFTCKLENPSKETKLGGLKTFVAYKIHPQIPGSQVVSRRYKQFDWLHEQLVNKYRFICIPPLPVKQIAGRFEQEFVEDRRRQLELWLNRICHHPVLCASFPVQHFITCELTEKNNKDWKAGKRKVEKDEFREASWLYCVTFSESKLSDIEIASQIDIFAQQQPGLETHLKTLNQGFGKYLDRHTEIYERDIQRVGELFIKLHAVIHADAITMGIDNLSNSMSKISDSYNIIAELYKTKGYEGIRDFLERIQEYLGLLTYFPMILNIHRSATEFIRNAQTRSTSTTSDSNGTLHRNQILNHVVLAEINYFQKEKVQDLKLYMKNLLDQQIDFYEKITSELRNALSTFN